MSEQARRSGERGTGAVPPSSTDAARPQGEPDCSIEIRVQAGRCRIRDGTGREATRGQAESIEAFVREFVGGRRVERITVLFSAGALQAVTRSFSRLPSRAADRQTFLDRTLERDYGKQVLDRRIGQLRDTAFEPGVGAASQPAQRGLTDRRGRRPAPVAEKPAEPLVLVTDLFAEPGVAAEILECARGLEPRWLEAGVDVPGCALRSREALLTITIEPERVILAVYRNGVPLAIRPLTDPGEPGAALAGRSFSEAILSGAKELMLRVGSRGVVLSQVAFEAPSSASTEVGDWARKVGAHLGLGAKQVPGQDISIRPPNFVLRRPPGRFSKWLGAAGALVPALQRALPIALLLTALIQGAVIWAAGESVARCRVDVSRLTGLLADVERAPLATGGEPANRISEILQLRRERDRSLHRLLSVVEPLLPANLRLTAVELTREGRITLAGRARDPESLTSFFSRLQQAPGFRGVFLTNERRVKERGGVSKGVIAFTLQGSVVDEVLTTRTGASSRLVAREVYDAR